MKEIFKKMWKIVKIVAVFVMKQVETDVFEGQERDGRRRGRKNGGRMEEEPGSKTVGNGGNEGRRVSLRA